MFHYVNKSCNGEGGEGPQETCKFVMFEKNKTKKKTQTAL